MPLNSHNTIPHRHRLRAQHRKGRGAAGMMSPLERRVHKRALQLVEETARQSFHDSPVQHVRTIDQHLEQNTEEVKTELIQSGASAQAVAVPSGTHPSEKQAASPATTQDDRVRHTSFCFDNGIALLKVLGKGGQAFVYHARRLSDGHPVALKVLPHLRKAVAENEQVVQFLLNMRRHENITTVHNIFTRPSLCNSKVAYRYVVQDLAPGADALSYLIERSHFPKWKDRCMSEDEVRPIIYGLLKGLQHLHLEGAIHRDVKPENCVYDPATQSLKLIDFGHLILCEADGVVYQPNQRNGAGTRFYRAPETLVGYYGPACDMWGVGVSMFTLLFAYVPFQYSRSGQELSAEEEAAAVCRGFDNQVCSGVGPFFPKSIPCSPEARALMAGLLCTDMGRRMTAEEALQSPWFQSCRR